MSNLNSALTKQGLNLCKQIYDKTGISTYYYLYRAYCKSFSKEKERKCPSCLNDWLLQQPWHNIFDFKCDECFLLSNLAWNVR